MGCGAVGFMDSNTSVTSKALARGSTGRHSAATQTLMGSRSPSRNAARNVATHPAEVQVEQLDTKIASAKSARALTRSSLCRSNNL
jgi:hypothetical protein